VKTKTTINLKRIVGLFFRARVIGQKHRTQARTERRNLTELNCHGLVLDELTNEQAGSLVEVYARELAVVI